MATQVRVSPRPAPWQFSLAQLLSFIPACAIYFGLLRISISFVTDRPYGNFNNSWRLIVTIILGWGGLWALYRYWKLPAAMTVHYTGPIACGVLALLVLSLGLLCQQMDAIYGAFCVQLYGLFVSVIFGFPVVVIMLVYRGLGRK